MRDTGTKLFNGLVEGAGLFCAGGGRGGVEWLRGAVCIRYIGIRGEAGGTGNEFIFPSSNQPTVKQCEVSGPSKSAEELCEARWARIS